MLVFLFSLYSDIEMHLEDEMYCFTIAQVSATLSAMLPWSPRPTEYPGFLRQRFVGVRPDGDIGDNKEGNICHDIDIDISC